MLGPLVRGLIGGPPYAWTGRVDAVMLRLMRVVGLPFILLLVAPAAQAKVESAGPTAFEISGTATVDAAPAAAWAVLVAPARWWNPAHSWSGDAANLSIDAQAGGCFCERWAAGSAEHMRVVKVETGRSLRMTGALGPLQAEGVTGAMTIALEPAGAETRVSLRYAASGGGGLDRIAPAVDRMLAEQLARLKAAVERR